MVTRLSPIVLASLLVCGSAPAGDDTISTFAGLPPTLVEFNKPHGLVMTASGVVYFADAGDHMVVAYDPTAGYSIVAGISGSSGNTGDGGAATSAKLEEPRGLALDSAGNLFIADMKNHTIRRVDASTGVITLFAGTGSSGYTGDGGAATAADIAEPYGLAIDDSDNLFFADKNKHVVRRIDAVTGIITTVAGTGSGGYDGDGVLATTTRLKAPFDVAIDATGNVYLADTDNRRVRMVDAGTGLISTITGTGSGGYTGDGGDAALAQVGKPYGLHFDLAGNLFLADFEKHVVRRIDAATNIITTVAGNGSGGYEGDEGDATLAKLKEPAGVVTDADGRIYIADQGNTVLRLVETDGTISTVAGGASSGDGGLAVLATMNEPIGVTVSRTGNVYIAEKKAHVIRRVEKSTGIITTVAGTGSNGYTGDGGLATLAKLEEPYDVAVDSSGNVFIACLKHRVIRRVDAVSGIITTVAGTGDGGYTGDGGPATMAKIDQPYGIAVDADGNFYIADKGKHVVRKVDVATGLISTVAGTGSAGYEGDGGLATSAKIEEPFGVDLDRDGNIYIALKKHHVIRKVDATTGIITTIAGIGSGGYTGDGGLATLAKIEEPHDVAVDRRGNVYIAGKKKHVIRKVDSETGFISTVAGIAGSSGHVGDGGPAVSGQINEPWGVAVSRSGGLYIAERVNHDVRYCDFQNTINIISWQETDPTE